MRNVKVHGINGSSTRDSEEDDGGKKSLNNKTVFQLLVKESQLEALTLANSLGELQLNLRPFGEDRNETEDNGEEFLSWINESETVEEEEDDTPVFTQFNIPTPKPTKKKHSMVIITPNGAKTYEWSEKDELPQEVLPEEGKSAKSNLQANVYGGQPGNVYSGYGGYSPTYPVSTPSAPAPEGDAPQADADGQTATVD